MNHLAALRNLIRNCLTINNVAGFYKWSSGANEVSKSKTKENVRAVCFKTET